VPDCAIANLDIFTVWRSDRVSRTGGGVCVITRNATVTASVVHAQNLNADDEAEICTLDLHYAVSCIRLICVYRPPASDTCPNAFKNTKSRVSCLSSLCDCSIPVVLVGDFNLPNVDWSNSCIVSDSDRCSVKFSVFTARHALEQLDIGPTRGCNLLDLVITNEPFMISSVVTGQPFSTSDHCTVSFVLNAGTDDVDVDTDNGCSCFIRPDFNRADWDSNRKTHE